MNVSVPVNSGLYKYKLSNGYMMIVIFTRSDTSEQTSGYALKVSSPKPNRTLYTRLYRF